MSVPVTVDSPTPPERVVVVPARHNATITVPPQDRTVTVPSDT